ncbi:patatin-like phospholipase family protein [Pseudorhodoplanes sp.]|uniref:patatin-like phospholipase family protein n=1 Tax=Pseudorhodoplanes sp. TaxID=1934341 RepID=UPI002BD317A7|nr:patatin-like phospholipase family protein [Pseudorhodoplanes sp.]HWV43787.1 patatin-like phospholipase family protein [Pseudorhodoplanes sp.]
MRLRAGVLAGRSGLRRTAALALCAMLVTACASVSRIPYTQQEQEAAIVPGIPEARVFADDPSIARRPLIDPRARETPVILALSGGGADGAFGAGLLNGWTERGDRPKFTVVTGASAGALIAPFAFLGSQYDSVLAEVFSSGAFEGFLKFQGLRGLFGTSLFEAGPLRQLIAKHVTPDIIEAVAREYRAGRRLYIVSTQLDAQRTAIWDMGAIASSRDPRAPELFRQVIEASASIPGIFSPVLIDVEAHGKRFQEMHVDGGIITNLLLVPEAMLVANRPIVPSGVRPRIYVILNSKLGPYFDVVPANTVRVAIRSFETSVRANTRNTLLASYEFIRRRNWTMTLAAIDEAYPSQTSAGFDTAYMKGLFDFGVEQGRTGAAWRRGPGSDTPPVARNPRIAAQ